MYGGQRRGRADGDLDSDDIFMDRDRPDANSTENNYQQAKNMLTTCQDCGLTWKNGHGCKATGKICLKCGQIGHFARVCRFTGEEDSLKQNDGNKSNSNSVKKIKKAKRSSKSDSKENRSDFNFSRHNGEANNNNKQNFKDKQRGHTESQKTSFKDDEAMKEEANGLYKQGKFKQALAKYTKLIELCPTNANHYSNRSACYMMMEQYEHALIDARKTIEIDPKHIKAHTRLVKCAVSLGKTMVAETALTKLSEVDPSNEILAPQRKKLKEVQKHLENETEAVASKQYKKALLEINKCLATCNKSIPFKLRKGEYLALLGRYKDAEAAAKDVLLVESSNIEAKYILGLCIYQSDVDRAVDYLRETLRLVPDHKKLVSLYKKAKKLADKKKAGNDAVKNRDYDEALKFYAEAMAVDPKNTGMKKKLHYNMALAYYKLGSLRKTIEECSKALGIDPMYMKALMRRGRCYMDLKEWEEAVKDLTRACKLDDDKDCRKLLDEAKQKLATVKKDYYKIIGVSRNASQEDIKKAYRQQALLHHPDRHATATHEELKMHEKKFKEITQAYRIIMKNHKANKPQPHYHCAGCSFSHANCRHDDDDDDDDEWEPDDDEIYRHYMRDVFFAFVTSMRQNSFRC
ncbi:dnaJ homolog subfamily C member 7 [Diachasma alloeum]|uniref:dnaJ homolog subfamily C member 7 n=1 Tax=Diachasma alloeum TaxID=454923 RepID=UPI00073843BD|nr:dnaJ homolog subfamily C member 7 [Diachasma alloeum]